MTNQMAEVRAKRKKPLSPFNQSPYREDYVRLIRAGWSSVSLERYAKYRYKEEIPASTFRNHMRKIQKDETSQITRVTGKNNTDLSGTEIDVMQVRQSLIALQIQRLSVDVTHEFQMSKLFTSTREEMKLLSNLLNEAKADQKDFGVLAPADTDEAPAVPAADDSNAPKYQTFGQMLGLQPGQDEKDLVEQLAKVIPIGSPQAV